MQLFISPPPQIISIHALLAESDLTLPKDQHQVCHHFYPRSPCGERPERCRMLDLFIVFLSTLSLRRATMQLFISPPPQIISIHALLAESDLTLPKDQHQVCHHFYPRSPCGERPERCRMLDLFIVFLSTLSLRRATMQLFISPPPQIISIHALLAESDYLDERKSHNVCRNFYPRSPCGERPHLINCTSMGRPFLSTLSLRRATRPVTMHTWRKVFLSTLSLRRATPLK